MKFNELFTPINKMSPPEAVAFFLDFCQKRADSFVIQIKEKKTKPAKEKTKPSAVKNANDKMVSVTPEELALLRKMKLIK